MRPLYPSRAVQTSMNACSAMPGLRRDAAAADPVTAPRAPAQEPPPFQDPPDDAMPRETTVNMMHGDIVAADPTTAERTADLASIRLGKRMRDMRKLRQMTQADLGRFIGITPQQVQKYETGLNRVSAATLVRIAQALRISPLLLISSIWPEAEMNEGSLSSAYLDVDVTERVAIVELYGAIADPEWRRRAKDLLELMAKARSA